MTRSPRRVLAALVFLALVAGPTAAQADGPTAKQLTLRLADVPGYVIERTGPDDTCSAPVFTDEVRRDVRRLLERAWHDGCNLMLERNWIMPAAQPGPSSLQSVADVIADPEAATALLRHPRALASSVVPISRAAWRMQQTTAVIGDETRLLHAVGTRSSDEGLGAAVLWRSGSVIALVYATGCDRSACEREALRLAAVQQARIATPTPLLPSDFDDSEVGLHDPRLDVPVWWTGRDFVAPGLRRVRLLSSISADPSARRYGQRITLTYGLNEDRPAFEISLFVPSVLERPRVRRAVRSAERDRCVRVERTPTAAGTATLYTRRRRCRTDAIDQPGALVRPRDVLVAISCSDCYSDVRRSRTLQRYGTPAAMRAIVRALRVREPSMSGTP